MKLLLIGGTRFLGRHIVEAAIARGHELTLFHRGQTGKGLFDVEEILGDRDGEIGKLSGRRWDAVIDTCGYFPRVVGLSANQLAESVGSYCFISTISVYTESAPRPIPEEGELIRFATPPEEEVITNETYGGFKVLCEEAVERTFGASRSLIIRPGLIVGPYDPSDRFTYWVDRFSGRGEILVPNRGDQPTQFIDVRDLAEFIVRQVEKNTAGVYNVTGPAQPMTMGDLWQSCRENCGGLPEEIVVSDDFLADNKVQEWIDLPFLIPKEDEMLLVTIDKAFESGLTIRPLAETVAATAEWHRTRGEVELKAGMSRQREKELLEKWKAQMPLSS
jgi:2'-hydroxyisoflavone reductase